MQILIKTLSKKQNFLFIDFNHVIYTCYTKKVTQVTFPVNLFIFIFNNLKDFIYIVLIVLLLNV